MLCLRRNHLRWRLKLRNNRWNSWCLVNMLVFVYLLWEHDNNNNQVNLRMDGDGVFVPPVSGDLHVTSLWLRSCELVTVTEKMAMSRTWSPRAIVSKHQAATQRDSQRAPASWGESYNQTVTVRMLLKDGPELDGMACTVQDLRFVTRVCYYFCFHKNTSWYS